MNDYCATSSDEKCTGTYFFLIVKQKKKKRDGSAKASFHSQWRVNSVSGASGGGGSQCKGCPPPERAHTLLSSDQRGGDTGRRPTARFLFVVPCANASLRVSAQHTHNKRNICIQSTISLRRKISWSSCRCSSFVMQATASARGVQAAAQRQRGIKQRRAKRWTGTTLYHGEVFRLQFKLKYEKNVYFFFLPRWLAESELCTSRTQNALVNDTFGSVYSLPLAVSRYFKDLAGKLGCEAAVHCIASQKIWQHGKKKPFYLPLQITRVNYNGF